MRIAFSIPIQEFRNDGQKEDSEYDLFRSVLMLNEQLMNFYHADQLDLSTLLFSMQHVELFNYESFTLKTVENLFSPSRR